MFSKMAHIGTDVVLGTTRQSTLLTGMLMVHIGTNVYPKLRRGTHWFAKMVHIGADVLPFSL
jgi:hypothetical protein